MFIWAISNLEHSFTKRPQFLGWSAPIWQWATMTPQTITHWLTGSWQSSTWECVWWGSRFNPCINQVWKFLWVNTKILRSFLGEWKILTLLSSNTEWLDDRKATPPPSISLVAVGKFDFLVSLTIPVAGRSTYGLRKAPHNVIIVHLVKYSQHWSTKIGFSAVIND